MSGHVKTSQGPKKHLRPQRVNFFLSFQPIQQHSFGPDPPHIWAVWNPRVPDMGIHIAVWEMFSVHRLPCCKNGQKKLSALVETIFYIKQTNVESATVSPFWKNQPPNGPTYERCTSILL